MPLQPMKTNWQTKKLSEVLSVQNGYAFDSKKFLAEAGIPLIRIRDLKDGTITETNYKGDYDKKYEIHAGDFLIGMDGEFVCYEWKGKKALLNQRVCRLKDFNGLDSKFLFYGINKYLKDIEDSTGYITVKHISSKQIENIVFPCPKSISEQKRIVKILDDTFDRVVRAKENTKKNLENSKKLFESYLQSVFANPGKDWKEKKLDEVCDFFNGLWNGKKPPYVEVGVIRNTNFTKDGELDDSDIAFLNVEKKQLEKRKLQYGDIILEKSGGGPKQPVGRVIIFKKKDGIFSFSNFTSTIRVKDHDELDFNYLHKFLFFSYISGTTEGMQSHSTGIRNLNLGAYKKIKIVFPLIKEQKAIVKKFDALSEQTKKLEAIYEKKLLDLEELKKSILKRAFNGDL